MPEISWDCLAPSSVTVNESSVKSQNKMYLSSLDAGSRKTRQNFRSLEHAQRLVSCEVPLVLTTMSTFSHCFSPDLTAENQRYFPGYKAFGWQEAVP